MTDSDQTELPRELPPVGHLKKLRAVLPSADRIISFAKAVEQNLLHTKGSVAPADGRAVNAMRRTVDKRLDALGIPHGQVWHATNFPEGTRDVAAASKPFWTALESAMSAIVGVGAAEETLAKPRLP